VCVCEGCISYYLVLDFIISCLTWIITNATQKINVATWFPICGGCLRFGSGDDVGYEEKGEDDDEDGVAHDLTIRFARAQQLLYSAQCSGQ